MQLLMTQVSDVSSVIGSVIRKNILLDPSYCKKLKVDGKVTTVPTNACVNRCKKLNKKPVCWKVDHHHHPTWPPECLCFNFDELPHKFILK